MHRTFPRTDHLDIRALKPLIRTPAAPLPVTHRVVLTHGMLTRLVHLWGILHTPLLIHPTTDVLPNFMEIYSSEEMGNTQTY